MVSSEPLTLTINIDSSIAVEALGELKDELLYLRFFYQNADFGPAHGDVMLTINEYYVKHYAPIPEGYEYE